MVSWRAGGGAIGFLSGLRRGRCFGEPTRRQFWQWGLLPCQRLLVIALDFFIHFLAMHRQLGRRLDAHFDDVAFDPHDLNDNTAINHNAFAGFAGENEHDAWWVAD